MDCIRLPGDAPAFFCPETKRAIVELFWGGWSLYECVVANDGKRVEGTQAGVALAYSSADAWLWGRDAEVYKVDGPTEAAPHN